MKAAWLVRWIVCSVILLSACGPGTKVPIPPTGITPKNPERVPLISFTGTIPEPTLIYFLIDHSTPVTAPIDGCGELGKQNVEYVDFMIANIMKPSVAVNLRDSLFVGIGIFDTTYKRVIEPIKIDSIPPNWSENVPASDDNTFYTLGISGALDEMYDRSPSLVQKRVLVIVTDGYFSNETYTKTKASLEDAVLDRNDPNLQIEIAFLCDKHLATWAPIQSIKNIEVGKLENITQLIISRDINMFLPSGSRIILPTDSEILVPGQTISTNFVFWTTDPHETLTLFRGGTTFAPTFNNKEGSVDQPVSPLTGCISHIYTITHKPTSNWFLYVNSQSVFETGMLMEIREIGNNLPIDIRAIPQMEFPSGNWQECFSVELIWNTDQGSGIIELVSCNNDDSLCFMASQEGQNVPQGQRPGEVEIIIRFFAKEDKSLVWVGKTENLSLTFEAKYEFGNFVLPPPGHNNRAIQLDFIFNNVVFPNTPHIYLVSHKGNIANQDCPSTTYPHPSLYIRQLDLVDQCGSDMIIDKYNVCIFHKQQNSLKYTYSIFAHENVIFTCEYNELYFHWPASEEIVKEVTWVCRNLGQDTKCENIGNKPHFIN